MKGTSKFSPSSVMTSLLGLINPLVKTTLFVILYLYYVINKMSEKLQIICCILHDLCVVVSIKVIFVTCFLCMYYTIIWAALVIGEHANCQDNFLAPFYFGCATLSEICALFWKTEHKKTQLDLCMSMMLYQFTICPSPSPLLAYQLFRKLY